MEMDEKQYRASFVRELRHQLEADQGIFARIVGVSPAAVSRWENARALPSNTHWEYLHELDEELQCSSDPRRLIAMLKMAAMLCPQYSPLELLVQGQLEAELCHRLDNLELTGEQRPAIFQNH